MKAQGYDGTANMSGIHRGVQASIRERILIAQYVHSKVNLSICFKLSYCTFSSDVSVRIMMATMQVIEFAFQYSSKNG